MSLKRIVATALLAALAIIPLARAQDEKPAADDKDKDAARKLLAKAEDEYRSYFKRPETAFEYWAAIKFEMDVGKFDLAAWHMKLLLEKQPAEDVDKDLARIEAAEGMSTFLRLGSIKKWSAHPPFQQEAEKNIKVLLDRVTAAVDRSLSDPERFKKFIPRLDAPTEEERAYAFAQINRSKERAATYLIDALRLSVGKPLQRRIIEAMVRFDPELTSAWLEVLKAKDAKDASEADLRLTLLDIIARRNETRAVPYLWHLSAAPMYPPQVNARAKVVQGQLLNQDPSRLPPAKIALVELAERYYQHEVKFPASRPTRVWKWDGISLATKPVELSPRQAEEFFGLRYAREALDLEPAYLPAQQAFLNLTLDHTYGADLDQVLLRRMPPALQQLLGAVDADVLVRVLERGLDDGRIPVILWTVRALGERGEVRAARATVSGAPQGVTRALYYPDRRVQFAAAHALLQMPGSNVPVASTRIVDVLRRFVASGASGKAIIAYMPGERTAEIRPSFKETGLTPLFVANIKEARDKFGGHADVDVIFLHAAAGKELPFAISQIRGDPDWGRLPIFVLAPKESQDAVEKLAARHRHVKMMPEALLLMADELKIQIETAQIEASGAKLSPQERQEFAKASLDYLWRMARNEIGGYDVRPAQDAVVSALRSPDTATEALEIFSRLPGTEPQGRLAGVVFDAGQDKLRIPAAKELNRHVQKYGLMLTRDQIAQLKQAYGQAGDAQLKAELAITLGALGPSAQLTGNRLIQFRPDPPLPPPEKKEQKKEEKKDN